MQILYFGQCKNVRTKNVGELDSRWQAISCTYWHKQGMALCPTKWFSYTHFWNVVIPLIEPASQTWYFDRSLIQPKMCGVCVSREALEAGSA